MPPKAGLPCLLAGVQLSPRTRAVGRAEAAVAGSYFRSHLCVEASWPGTTGFAGRSYFFIFVLIIYSLFLSLTLWEPPANGAARSGLGRYRWLLLRVKVNGASH